MNFDKSIIGLHFLLIFSVLAKFQEDQIINLNKIKIDEIEKIKMKKKKKRMSSTLERHELKIDQGMKLLD